MKDLLRDVKLVEWPNRHTLVGSHGRPLEWSRTDTMHKDTRQVLATNLSVHDAFTGTTIGTNAPLSMYDSAAGGAWEITSYSRSPLPAAGIRQNLIDRGVDPDGKLSYYAGIGHTAPADMATNMRVTFDDFSMETAMSLLSLQVLSGAQEKSTRYQGEFIKARMYPIREYLPKDLDEQIIQEIEMRCERLGDLALAYYKKHLDVVYEAFLRYYEVDPNNKDHLRTLESRALDVVRVFLLMGMRTGLGITSSAREWSKLIGHLKGSRGLVQKALGHQLEDLLAPSPEITEAFAYLGQAPSLIRHTEPRTLTADIVQNLLKYLKSNTDFYQNFSPTYDFRGQVNQNVYIYPTHFDEGDRMVAQMICLMHPSLQPQAVLDWASNLPVEQKIHISRNVLFHGVDAHHEMLPHFKPTRLTAHFDATFAILRDFQRHRSPASRTILLPSILGLPTSYAQAQEILSTGFVVPIHLELSDEFQGLANDLSADMLDYYQGVYALLDAVHSQLGDSIDYSFIVNVLPLGHKSSLVVHGDVNSLNYIKALRERNGGDVSYTKLAYDLGVRLREVNPWFSGLEDNGEPQPLLREVFFDRS